MNVGLPGTGIGGLFYLLLAVLMPVHASWSTLHGRASAQQWRLAARHSMLAVSIISALWVESWVIRRVVAWIATTGWLRAGILQGAYTRLVAEQATVVALVSALTLVTLLVVVHAAGWYAGFREARSTG